MLATGTRASRRKGCIASKCVVKQQSRSHGRSRPTCCIKAHVGQMYAKTLAACNLEGPVFPCSPRLAGKAFSVYCPSPNCADPLRKKLNRFEFELFWKVSLESKFVNSEPPFLACSESLAVVYEED